MADREDELGADVAKLVTAVQDWARSAFSGGHRVEPGAAPGDCVPWCPICQFAGVLRGEHPEVAERLAEAGAALTGALKALSDAALTRAQPAQPGDARHGRPKPAPRVQRIRLDEPDEV